MNRFLQALMLFFLSFIQLLPASGQLLELRITQDATRMTVFCYDLSSNLTQKTTANGQSIIFSYDALNRLTQKRTPEQTYAFTYDSLSRMIGASNAADRLSFSYDIIGNLTQSTVNSATLPADRRTLFTANLSYAYDLAGRKISMVDPTGSTAYAYDRASRVTSIAYSPLNLRGDGLSAGSVEEGVTFNLAYDAGGRRTSLTGPAGLQKTYSYDQTNRLLSLINQANGREVAPFQYQYDRVGNKTRTTDKDGLHNYAYDAVYRLLNATNTLPTNGAETFNYDLTGNRTRETGNVSQNYTANSANQLVSGSNGLRLTYDANGNVTSKTENGVTWTYVWNSENQLIQSSVVSPQSSVRATYAYDALGRRVSKSLTTDNLPLTTVSWIYDGSNILLEYTNGVLFGHYTHGPGIDEPLAKTDIIESKSYFYHSDALGSTTALTDSAGTIAESYRYNSYGQPTIIKPYGSTAPSSQIKNPFLFTGREWDAETGLYYYRARYHDPSTGRFISKDPIGFAGGINIYAYVVNNPVNYTDPSGLDRTTWVDIGGGRTPADGPRNGNWCGGKWSGGVSGGKIGNASYLDSGDFCCMRHDFCWARCERDFKCDPKKLDECKRKCNRELIACLKKLPRDPQDRPEPPASGTIIDSGNYRDGAIRWFRNDV